MNVIEVKGIDKVVNNLARTHKIVGARVEAGLLKAGAMIMRESQKIVPVQLGNLKAAAFERKEGSGTKAVVTIGYEGVSYAAYVHEIPGLNLSSPVTHGELFNIKHAADIVAAKGTKWGTAAGGMFKRKPQEQWKFLEHPVRDNANKVLDIISTEIKKTK